MVISSVKNQKVQEVMKLKQKKYRDKSNLFIIEGEKLIRECYNINILKEIIILENEEINISIEKTIVKPEIMKKLTNLKTFPKIIGICEKKENNKNLGNKILYLDQVQDPGNIGTIIRSAYAFGIETIILKDSCDAYNEKVIRASLGYIFNINIIETNVRDELKSLLKNGYQIIATKVDGGNNIKNIEINNKFVIIVGNEGKGISDELLELATDYAYIKMSNNCESLNVAVATSILLYEIGER